MTVATEIMNRIAFFWKNM